MKSPTQRKHHPLWHESLSFSIWLIESLKRVSKKNRRFYFEMAEEKVTINVDILGKNDNSSKYYIITYSDPKIIRLQKDQTLNNLKTLNSCMTKIDEKWNLHHFVDLKCIWNKVLYPHCLKSKSWQLWKDFSLHLGYCFSSQRFFYLTLFLFTISRNREY